MNKSTPSQTTADDARSRQLKTCLECGHLMPMTTPRCPVCRSVVYERKQGGMATTVALLLASVLLFIPANLLPIMKTTSLGIVQEDTILSGIIYFWQSRDYFVAVVVFVASFITPLFKMLSMVYLCYTCHRQSKKHTRWRTELYHFTELIGRWSMIDVFVVALLGALVKMGSLASIEPQSGILAFALVVFLTMFATERFDPRWIWDNAKNGDEKEKQ